MKNTIRKSILFYCPEDIFQPGGGATVAKNVLKNFKSQNKDLIVFSTKTEVPLDIENNFKTLKIWYPKSGVGKVLYDLFIAPLILLFFFRKRVICLNSLVPLLYPFRVEVFFQMRMFHFEELDSFQKKIKNKLGRLSIKRCKYVYVASKDHKNDLVRHLNESSKKIKVAYLGFDPNLDIVEDPNGLSFDGDYWVFISIFRPYKNLDGLIEAYAALYGTDEHIPDLVIIGDYPSNYVNIEGYKLKIKQLVKKNKLEEKVHFIGLKSHNKAMWYLKNSSLFIFPTRFEGFGLPLLEAMSLSIPIISSGVHSLTEIGLDTIQYFDPDKKDNLYNVLLDFHQNGYHKDLTLALERSKYFTWDKTCDVILKQA